MSHLRHQPGASPAHFFSHLVKKVYIHICFSLVDFKGNLSLLEYFFSPGDLSKWMFFSHVPRHVLFKVRICGGGKSLRDSLSGLGCSFFDFWVLF